MAERTDSLDHAWDLLERLADGGPISGEALGEALGLTRAAIWKQVDALRRAGLPVEAATGSGYQLPAPLELLDAGAIRSAAGPGIEEVVVLRSVASTNAWLREHGTPAGCLVLAERQTEGRGRRGRDWSSPLGAGLLMSLGWRTALPASALGSLSLVVGLAVCDALAELGVDPVQLKWPNDLEVGGAKLGGILIELQGEAHGSTELIIGLGLNHRLPPDARPDDRAVTDLATLTDDAAPGRNALAATVVRHLVAALGRYEHEGFAAFAADYARRDALAGRELDVDAAEPLRGRHAGVAEDGALLLDTEGGPRRVYAGEVSVRAAR